MILLSANNANTTLAAGISSSTTTIILATGTGALFPSPGTNQYFPVTLNDALTGLVYEICWCTSRTGDNLTVLRGQEGTTARAWLLGDYAYNANTAGNIQTGRAFSATNTPTLPFTVPAAHNGVTQICTGTGTITLPPTSSIQDGFLCPILCASSSATITVNTNSASVALPTGAVIGSFTIGALAGLATLQWSAAEAAWYPVSLSAGKLLNIQPFSASGTYNSTPGTTRILVKLKGGGGAGAGAPACGAGQTAVGSGGTEGTYGEGEFTSGFQGGLAVTVGAGGAGASGARGSAGGTSSLGSLISAPGGPPGQLAGPGAGDQSAGGLAGAMATGANINDVPGAPGGVSFAIAGFTVASAGAGPGGGPAPANSTNGIAATGPGAGGSGTAQTASSPALTGGAGAAGYVIIYEYA